MRDGSRRTLAACFETVRQQADSIILLEPPASVRIRRILLRWVKQNLRIEACGYTPDLAVLRLMFKWTRNYDSGADGVKERLIPYGSKISVVRNERNIRRYIVEHVR